MTICFGTLSGCFGFMGTVKPTVSLTDIPPSQMQLCEGVTQHRGDITKGRAWNGWNTDRYRLDVCAARHKALTETLKTLLSKEKQ